jgi:hypothetical protein
MRPTPEMCSEETINQLWDGGPVLPTSIPELFFSSKNRRPMAFDRIPVGHSMGWRCYDLRKHDPESAFESGEFGDGLTQDEAYVAWLNTIDEEPNDPSDRTDEQVDDALHAEAFPE